MKRIFTEAQKKANCERAKIWYRKNSVRARIRIARWAKENPDKVQVSRGRRKKQISEGKKRWYRANKEWVKIKSSAWVKKNAARRKFIARTWARFSRIGFTESQFNNLWKKQSGQCCICETVFRASGEACIDHCHATGKIRGLLCRLCNAGLGMFRDSPENLNRGAVYLQIL